jgi:isopentenyl diphosphate isomerase/L-lactate dehydrogenase-like FMN-dependent dehydrogenase
MVWALAVGGEAGVLKMMRILEDELRLGMCLLGCSSLKNLDDRYLFHA